MRKHKEVKVDGELFVVHELRIGDMIKILPQLSNDEKSAEATMELMKLCVHQGGTPMGEKIEDLGLSTFMTLSEHVMEVNGLSGKV